MAMGADVQWLSAFPHEAEILYLPLTYLKPTGRSQVACSAHATRTHACSARTHKSHVTHATANTTCSISVCWLPGIEFLCSQMVEVESGGQHYTFTVVEVYPQLS